MARLSRHELKQDEFRTTVEEFEHFAKQHFKEITGIAAALIVIAGAAVAFTMYNQRQDAEANALLGAALKTFHAAVGAPTPDQPGTQTFPSAAEKYKRALQQFEEILQRYPRQKAADFARYHAGLCQAQLGDANAIKKLQQAAGVSDRNVASLAELALAGEFAKDGKTADAARIYQQLADHPASTVPRATALLSLADLYRDTQPAQARAIYEKVEKEFGSDSYLAATVKQQMATLPK